MTMTSVQPAISTTDRLGFSTFFSLLLHMVLILGISFTIPMLRELQGAPTLEVTLVQTESDAAPDKADFLAQANQQGGGDSPTNDVAHTPLPVREISERNMDTPSQPQLPRPRLKQIKQTTGIISAPDSQKIAITEAKRAKTEPELRPREMGFLPQIEPQEQRARQWAEINRRWQERQRRPRHKYMNANTREYKYAAYIAAWEAKVRRIGNLNYPERIKQMGLSGRVELDVAIRPDGSIHAIHILRSSGNELLDKAAVRAARLAAPFAPLPTHIRSETDVLHIARAWEYNISMKTAQAAGESP